MRRAIASLVLAGLVAAGCGGRRTAPPSGPVTQLDRGALCRIDDHWTLGDLRAPRGGFEFVQISGGEAQATLERAEGALRVRAFVRRGGWSFHGRLDPAQGDGLRARSALQIGEGVFASAGTEVAVLDARPGSLAVGMPEHAPGPDDGVRFTGRVGAWVPCNAVGLSFRFRDERTVLEERRALGLPQQPPEAVVAAGSRATLSSEPGGAPFAELAPTEHALGLHVVEERLPHVRVLVHHWTGTMILGWTSADSLSAPDAGAGGLGVLGGLAGPRTLRVCTSPERLEIVAAQGQGAAEPVGTVDAGTRFVVAGEAPGGVIQIRPHPADSVSVTGEGVVWTARTSAPLTCAEETHDPAAGLASLLRPAASYAIRATVTASSGDTAPATGSECTAQLQHFPGARYPCRIEVRCGEHVVYGHRPTNGAFECELIPDVPSVRGRDVETSAASGDGAMSIDSGQRSLVIDDDAEGPIGAFHLEARIDALERSAL